MISLRRIFICIILVWVMLSTMSLPRPFTAFAVPVDSTFMLSAEGHCGYVSLRWTPVEGAERYYIYRGIGEDNQHEMPLTDFPLEATSYHDGTDILVGVQYCYFVRAIGSDHREFLQSVEACAVPTCSSSNPCEEDPIEEDCELSLKYQVGHPNYWVNEQEKGPMEAVPEIRWQRMFLVIRFVTQEVGASISWDGTHRLVTIITPSGNRIEFQIDNPKYKLNGIEDWVDPNNTEVAPFIKAGRTLIPLRRTGEALDAKDILWHGESSTAELLFDIPGCGCENLCPYPVFSPATLAAPVKDYDIVSSCKMRYYVHSSVYAFPINARGNSMGNIVNMGFATQQGDWIYYCKASDGGKIYKIRKNGTEKTKLNEDRSGYINVIGSWIYYQNQSDGLKLYKIRTDGTGRTKLNDDYNDYINVVGAWIYYQNWADYGKPYKIRTDGTERTKLGEFISYFLCVENDWIYYIEHQLSADLFLYKIRTDGTERTKLSDEIASSLSVEGEWIYYRGGERKLYKIRTDGTGKTKISDDKAFFINVEKDWIYYSNGSDGYKLYKIRSDGTGRTKLNDDNMGPFNILGDWIYYQVTGDIDKLYKIRTDGTGRQEVNGFTEKHDPPLRAMRVVPFEDTIEVLLNSAPNERESLFALMERGACVVYQNRSGNWRNPPANERSVYRLKFCTDGPRQIEINGYCWGGGIKVFNQPPVYQDDGSQRLNPLYEGKPGSMNFTFTAPAAGVHYLYFEHHAEGGKPMGLIYGGRFIP